MKFQVVNRLCKDINQKFQVIDLQFQDVNNVNLQIQIVNLKSFSA